MASDRVMRWRLLLEEYGPTFKHLVSTKNIIADALSRLTIGDDDAQEIMTLID